MDGFVTESHNPALHLEQSGRTHAYSTGQPWTTCEEGLLQAIVQRAQLPRRTTRAHWGVVADHLAQAGQQLGLPLRSPSSCWRKASRMGLIARRPEKPTVADVAAVQLGAQASFASPEVKAEVSRSLVSILRRIADELEHA